MTYIYYILHLGLPIKYTKYTCVCTQAAVVLHVNDWVRKYDIQKPSSYPEIENDLMGKNILKFNFLYVSSLKLEIEKIKIENKIRFNLFC